MSTTTVKSPAHQMAKPSVFKALNMVEQAEVVHQLTEVEDIPHAEVAKMVAVTTPQISNLRLVHEFPKTIKKAIKDGKLAGTLVLDTYRAEKAQGKSDEQIFEVFSTLLSENKGRVTKKNLLKVMHLFNSQTELKKFYEKYNENDVKDDTIARIIFQLGRDILMNKISFKDLEKRVINKQVLRRAS
jgi:Ca2+-binding EF-hand superfamily protein